MKSGAKIWLKIPVGTTKSYLGKLPGHLHLLYIHLAVKGKKDALAGAHLIEFPKGYCQPPDVRVIRETYRVDRACKDEKRLVTLDVTVKNSGGPLGGRKWSVYAFEFGGTGLSSSGVWVPPLAPGAQAPVTIPVGVMKNRTGQLPGSHSLRTVSLNTLTGKKNITPIAITLPKGICRPLTRPTPSQMHLRTSRTLAVRPPPRLQVPRGTHGPRHTTPEAFADAPDASKGEWCVCGRPQSHPGPVGAIHHTPEKEAVAGPPENKAVAAHHASDATASAPVNRLAIASDI